MIVVDDEPLARERVVALLPPNEMRVVGQAGSARAAREAIERLAPDIVFLDIELGDGTGFDVLETIPDERLPFVVFVTAYDSYAVRAFDAAAIDYVLKPIDPVRLHEAARRALAIHQSDFGRRQGPGMRALVNAVRGSLQQERVVLRDSETGRSHFVNPGDIFWIEAKRNNCLVHMADRTIVVRETLSALLDRLPSRTSARAHRSTAVNLSHIRYAEPYFRGEFVLVLGDGTRLVTSRGMGQNLHDLLGR